MKSDKEVTKEVQRRMDVLRAQNAGRKNRFYTAVAMAASLVLVIGLAVGLPRIVPEVMLEAAGQYSATLLAGSGVNGYVLIGVVAFTLGVAVTLLCLKFFNKKR